MKNILVEIIENKKNEIENSKKIISLSEIKNNITNEKDRDFLRAISANKVNIIAEIKKASPSKGLLKENFDVSCLAKSYEAGGAAAISVLTEKKYFLGDPSYIREAKQNCNIPILRKDFIVDEYQVYESKFLAADAILLIAAVLEKKDLERFLDIARNLNLDCLVEVHTKEELEKVLALRANIIGINNRNLENFSVTLDTTFDLVKNVSGDKVVVSESGIFTHEDICKLQESKVNAVLIGESIVVSADPTNKIRELIGVDGY